jgi:ribosome-binding protein aMBF1 (putative translation factor)
MKTWNDYKEYAKSVDMEAKKDIEEAESLAEIVGAMIRQRNAMGISQRELAAMCNMPQSSVARIESLKTTPNLDTILKLFKPLGLALTVSVKRV